MRVELKGQVALVTGAARGIGQAIADMLTDNGARVVYADIDSEGVKSAAKGKPGAMPLLMDVSNYEQVEAGIREIRKTFERLDILVNNAGVNSTRHRVNIDQFPIEEWERIYRIDATGTFLVSRAAVPVMLERRYGRIVNISSVLGVVPARLQCAFTSAKAALAQLTRSMALELGPAGILVNCVAPGSTLTDGTRQYFYNDDAAKAAQGKRLLSHVPLARPGTVQEIAEAVLFFCAPENSYTTGQILCVDGGWTAGGFLRDF